MISPGLHGGSDYVPGAAALREVGRIVGALVAEGAAPGVAYGIVTRAGLAHAGGAGVVAAGGGRPGAGSVFRVASMSKSFTAAAVLLLQEQGRLDIHAPVRRYLPEFAGVRPYSGDSPEVSVAMLLSMASGFATDDPWGDRQESLSREEFFTGVVAAGLRGVAAPGVLFEYSNTNFALLGAIVERVGGMAFPGFVRRWLLEPLGLRRTGYDFAEVEPGALAAGHHFEGDGGAAGGGCGFAGAEPGAAGGGLRRAGRWVAEAFSGPGAYSAMGGVLSCVEDVAGWVRWLADAFPARDGGEAGPLSRAARRAMQSAHMDVPPVIRAGSSRGRLLVPDFSEIRSYGYGLFVSHDPVWGNIAHHPGGYPGYGSDMRWHLDSGIGVIALANGRYAPAMCVTNRALRVLLEDAGAAGRTVRLWPEVRRARDALSGCLLAGGDPFALPLFSENVAMDRGFEARRGELRACLEEAGAFVAGAAPVEVACKSEAHLVWTLQGERGRLRCEIGLTPEAAPRVQTFEVGVEGGVSTDDVVARSPVLRIA